LGTQKQWPYTFLLGAGEFLTSEEAKSYGFPLKDSQDTPVAAQDMDLGFGVQLTWPAGNVQDLFERGVRSWSTLLVGAK